MTSNMPTSNSPDPSPVALRRILEDLQDRISFMRDVVRGNCEPFESPDEWLSGLKGAADEAEPMARAVLVHLRTVGKQWDFGGCSYACDAEALIGFARRIVVGDYHDPLAPLPILDIGSDGRLEDPRVLRMNMFRTSILMADDFETLAAQVRRSCSLLTFSAPGDTGNGLLQFAKDASISKAEWRRSFTSLRGRDDIGPRRLWRIVSRLASKKLGATLQADESCGWNYAKGKVRSHLYRDRASLMQHKVRDMPVMSVAGESAHAYVVQVPLPDWFLDELDKESPIDT